MVLVKNIGLRWRSRDKEADMDVVQVSKDYAVGWFTLALINAGLAQSKGRSGGNWFFVSLFLGPVATFAIVITDPPTPTPTPK
jgi:hypothetical protein